MQACPLAHLVARVRAFDRFPKVDAALAAIRAEALGVPGGRVRRLGDTRAGERLELISLGSGPCGVLVVAGPHPNEPVGLLTSMELARLIAEAIRAQDPAVAPFTWHILPCWDLDGARLNESWYTAPPSVESYHRHFYRPAMAGQPEWTFPLDVPGARFDRPLPETTALMGAIDELAPQVLCSLHNSDVGGAFYILDQDRPALAEELTRLPALHGLPVDVVSVDTLGWASPAPGVHVLPPADALHRPADASGGIAHPDHGACSLHYAQRHATRGILAEVPQWRVERPPVPPPGRWAPAIGEQAEHITRTLAPLQAALEAAGRTVPDSLFLPAVQDTLQLAGAAANAWRNGIERPEDPQLAEALWNAVYDGSHLLPLRALGMWQRMFPDSPTSINGNPLVRRATEHSRRSLGPLCESFETETSATPFPLRELVAAQLSAIFTTASHDAPEHRGGPCADQAL
ncbi:hypothetical protein [Streptomyces palmae]|uniref:Peptidase M14 carboxypeptidase A domain-containing protein n=1 Tax=Streptomyces palmae TaxID=1701085 RepID=A0A4Z0H568_9ACTN|nr:hypothetical protein [Streptomyces palmae]TGB05704.1 hypothetical protein E4099_19030 [Streptomyces palmae]